MLRLGVLGTGGVAGKFAGAMQASARVQVCAVGSRTQRSATAFAAEHGIARAHGSYDALVADPALDAVYVALPNALHGPWTLRALAAGRHVICEKPLATREADARHLFDRAQSAGLYLREAFPYLAQPLWQSLRAIVGSGQLGRLVAIQASVGFSLQDRADIRLDAALDGGALADVGVYPLSLARVLMGERPVDVAAVSAWSSQCVDRSTFATLVLHDGAVVQMGCSLGCGFHRRAFIQFEAGSIETDFPNHTNSVHPGVLRVRDARGRELPVTATVAVDGFRALAESFADLVFGTGAGWTGLSPDQSIDIAAMVAAIRDRAAAPL